MMMMIGYKTMPLMNQNDYTVGPFMEFPADDTPSTFRSYVTELMLQNALQDGPMKNF